MLDKTFDAIRPGLRALMWQPWVAALVVFSLGLGIGANCALFAVVNSLVLRPLPYEHVAELVEVSLPQPGPRIADLRTAQSFSGVAAFVGWGFDVRGPDGTRFAFGFRTSPNLFAVLGVQAAVGRVFSPDDHQPVVVLSDEYWRRTSGDPRIIGRTLTISGEPYTVIGVLPPGFSLGVRDGNLFVPNLRDGGRIVARLKPGVSTKQALAEVTGILHGLGARPAPGVSADRPAVTPLAQAFRNSEVNTVLLLQATVALVLLMTCANVGHLLLVRSAARRRELAIRVALGAGRLHLFVQLMTESALFGAMGGALGVLIASWSLRWLRTEIPGNIARAVRGAEGLSIDGTVLAFTAGTSLLTVLLVGVAPALAALRADVSSALREAAKSAAPRRQRFGQVLVIGEIALALMLLIGASLTLKSLVGLQNANLGFNPHGVLRGTIDLQQTRYPRPEQRAAALAEIVRRCRALPGVETVGLLAPQFFPFGGPRVRGSPFTIQDRPEANARAEVYVANGEYFRAVGIPLLRGRPFTDADTAATAPVALISDVVAARYWGHDDPIGRLIRLRADDVQSPWVTIVGVVGDVRNPLALSVQPTAYRPYAQSGTGTTLLMIRTAGDPMAFADAVRKEIRAVDPDGPEFRIADLEAAVWDYVSPQRFTTSVIGCFALLGVLLAAVGVHGVMRHWVSLRIFDIGVRMALGAEPRDVLWLVLSKAGKATLIGLALGMAGAVALQRVIASLLYGVSPTDPIVLVTVATLIGAVALVAALMPARWAADVDPVVALRCE